MDVWKQYMSNTVLKLQHPALHVLICSFQIMAAACLVHSDFHMDKPAPKQAFQQHFCGMFWKKKKNTPGRRKKLWKCWKWFKLIKIVKKEEIRHVRSTWNPSLFFKIQEHNVLPSIFVELQAGVPFSQFCGDAEAQHCIRVRASYGVCFFFLVKQLTLPEICAVVIMKVPQLFSSAISTLISVLSLIREC